MEDMLVPYNQIGMCAQLTHSLSKMRVQPTELRGRHHEHSDQTGRRFVIKGVVLPESSTPPFTVITQHHTMITDVKVHEGATLQQLCHLVEEFIRIMDRSIVSIVYLLSLSSGGGKILGPGSKGAVSRSKNWKGT